MKMTDRDKMLLILLGVILVVALAAILPTFGVMDAINAKKESEASIADLDVQLETQLAEIRAEFGISDSAVAENPSTAKTKMEQLIASLESEGERLAANTLGASSNWSINVNWLAGMEYLGGVDFGGEATEDGEINEGKIVNVAFNNETSSSDSVLKTEEFEVGTRKVELNFYDRTIDTQAVSGYCVYYPSEFYDDYEMEDSAIFANYLDETKDIGAILLYLEHLSAKGAILIDNIQYTDEVQLADSSSDTSSSGSEESDGGYRITIRILMTSGQSAAVSAE